MRTQTHTEERVKTQAGDGHPQVKTRASEETNPAHTRVPDFQLELREKKFLLFNPPSL